MRYHKMLCLITIWFIYRDCCVCRVVIRHTRVTQCHWKENGPALLHRAEIRMTRSTGIRGLMRGMATLPQGNQELLVVRDKVGRPPGELGVSKSMESDLFPSVLWHCWLGDRKGIRPVNKTGCWFLLVVIISLELCTTYSSSSPAVTTTSFASINIG